MIGARIDAKLREHLSTESVPREHPTNGRADDAVGMRGSEKLVRCDRLDASLVTAVAVIGLLLSLPTGKCDLVGVHDDDVVTDVRMRCKARLVFAAEHRRDSRRESAQNQIFRVDDIPGAVGLVAADALRCSKCSIGHAEFSTPQAHLEITFE